jgi:hypothetical protein
VSSLIYLDFYFTLLFLFFDGSFLSLFEDFFFLLFLFVTARVHICFTLFSMLITCFLVFLLATEQRGVTITQLDSIDPTLVVYRAEATFVGVGLWDLYGAIGQFYFFHSLFPHFGLPPFSVSQFTRMLTCHQLIFIGVYVTL